MRPEFGAPHFRITVSNIRGGTGTLKISVAAAAAQDKAGHVSVGPVVGPAVRILGSRKLAVGIIPPPVRVSVGGTNVFAITYANTGTQASDAAAVVVKLPVNALFNAALSTAGWQNLGGGYYRLNLGTLAAGARGQVKFAVTNTRTAPVGTVVRLTTTITDALARGVALSTATVALTIGRSRWN